MRELQALRTEMRVLELSSLSYHDQSHNTVNGLIDMMKEIGHVESIIEIGSYRGVSTEVLAHFCDKLIAVDIWTDFPRAKREFDSRFSTSEKVSYLRMKSTEAAKFICDKSVDLVYIDALHDLVNVINDILSWQTKVKSGGYLTGHDYGDHCPEVIVAVDRVLGRKPDKVYSDSSWLNKVNQ